MTMVLDEVVGRETRHVLQTLPAPAGDASSADRACALCGRRGARVSRPALGHRRRGARTCASRTRARDRRTGADAHPHVEPLLSPAAGAAGGAAGEPVGLPRAFFCNSGTEAVEACLKFARRYWFTKGEPRAEVIALEESFHGRTFGSLSVTSDEHYRAPFEPLLPGVEVRAASTSRRALAAAVSRSTAAIIAEPVQGEGGVRPLTPAFAAAINEACARTGALFIADEVQSGLGRTGYPFYFAALGLKPHLVSVGKALGGGVPIGAALVSQEVADTISFGDHGSTYGGNLLACRAGALRRSTSWSAAACWRTSDASASHFEQRLEGDRGRSTRW